MSVMDRKWIIGTTRSNDENTFGLVAARPMAPMSGGRRVMWPDNASGADIAKQLRDLADYLETMD